MTEESNAGQNAEATGQASMADIAASVKTPEAPAAEAQTGTQSTSAEQGGQGGNKDEMRDFIAQQNRAMEEIRTNLDSTTKAVSTLTAREQQMILDQAVDKAVSTINDGVNGNADLAEAFLNSQYQKNPDLQKIFDNRADNPAALEKAMGILKTEWKAMNQKQIDPQVAENQRALQDSQAQGGTPQGEDTGARLEKMSDGEFMREMRKLARSN